MSRIHDILEDLRRRRHERRGEIRFFPPGTIAEIEEAVLRFASTVPRALADFYTTTNGLELGDFRIVPLIESIWVDPPMLAVQQWGNGDVDCIRIEGADDLDDPPVWFLGHDPPWVFEVSSSFSTWLAAVIDEYWTYGEIYSPWDCHVSRLRRLHSHK